MNTVHRLKFWEFSIKKLNNHNKDIYVHEYIEYEENLLIEHSQNNQ